MKLSTQILFFFSIFLFSCQNDQPNDVAIKSGTFFGMCSGYCKMEIEIIDRDIVFKASSWGNQNYPDTTIHGTISNQEWDSLIESVNMDTLMSLDDIIGCPDCADGGGEWIEITKSGTIKRVTFEYGKTVASIQNLIEKVRIIRERFNCEMFPGNC